MALDTATFPVIETFGPTIQGEGPLAGRATYFIRFGGCDYRCSWCDSMYAVDPAEVRANARKLTVDEILAEVAALDRGPQWVTLSGGNPAMLKLGYVVAGLRQKMAMKVCVETQGSRWNDWLWSVDMLTISPKPPSSGMATAKHAAETEVFLGRVSEVAMNAALKVVVFDEDDLVWALDLLRRHRELPAYLSCGTDPPGFEEPYATTLTRMGERYAWLCDEAATRAPWATVLPQLHVIAYGHRRGV